MAPKISIATHNMATKTEDELLTWYLFNAVINIDTGDILHYKYLKQAKKIKTRDLWKDGSSKEFG